MRHLALGHLPVCIFLFMENIAVEAEAEAEESRIRRSKQETRERKYAHRLSTMVGGCSVFLLLWAPFDFAFDFDARFSEYSPRFEIPLTFSHFPSVFGLHHHAHHPTCHA